MDTNSKEPKVGPNRGNAGKGRPKGSLNKTTQVAKDVIAQAADRLGGVDRLVNWAQEEPANERAFWSQIYPKLLPLQVNGSGEEGQFVHEIVRRVVDPQK